MEDHIRTLTKALESSHEHIARLYANPQGLYFGEDDRDITKLLLLRVVRMAHDGSVRLDSGLKRFIDLSANRKRLFGNSTHYKDLETNIATAVEGYVESICQGDQNLQAEKGNIVFELCDDYSTGMTDDVEQFRHFVQTNAGFSGSTLEDKVRYNINRLGRARELLKNIDDARHTDFLYTAKLSDELTQILEKEFYDRHDEIGQRLREVASDLSKSLFDLRGLDTATLGLIKLDNHLTKHPDYTLPSWESLDSPPECMMIFPGIDMFAFPEADSRAYGDVLAATITRVKDELPAPPRPRRNNDIDDTGAPEVIVMLETNYVAAFFKMIEDVLATGRAEAIDWLRENQEEFPYSETVWLQMISNNIANNTADIPECVKTTMQHEDLGFEYVLSNVAFCLESA